MDTMLRAYYDPFYSVYRVRFGELPTDISGMRYWTSLADLDATLCLARLKRKGMCIVASDPA